MELSQELLGKILERKGEACGLWTPVLAGWFEGRGGYSQNPRHIRSRGSYVVHPPHYRVIIIIIEVREFRPHGPVPKLAGA